MVVIMLFLRNKKQYTNHHLTVGAILLFQLYFK